MSITELRATIHWEDNVGPDLVGCRGMGTEIGAGLSGTENRPLLYRNPDLNNVIWVTVRSRCFLKARSERDAGRDRQELQCLSHDHCEA